MPVQNLLKGEQVNYRETDLLLDRFSNAQKYDGDPIYGVRWTNDDSITMLRTDNAENMSYFAEYKNGNIEYSSDFNNVFPWNETEIITDTLGNKFLHFPDMYFRVGVDEDGCINSVAVSKSEHRVGDWFLCKSFDYGIYGASLSNSTLKSVEQQGRLNNITRAQFRAFASANSETGYIYHQLDLKHKTVMMFLWWIEWAIKNSEYIMKGHIKGCSTMNELPIGTGNTNTISAPSGYKSNTWQMRWHNIEDFIGNFYEYVDGVCLAVENGYDYVMEDAEHFNDNRQAMDAVSWQEPGEGVIKGFGWDADKPFLVTPKQVFSGTNYSIAFCDGTGRTNFTPCLFGGSAYNNNSNIWGICSNGSSVTAQGEVTIGARLLRQEVENG